MIQDAIDSFVDIFSPPFRRVMLKSLALTAAILFAVGFGLDKFALSFVTTNTGWLATLISWMIGISVMVGFSVLAAPITSLVASFFLDEIAQLVEHEVDPTGPRGQPAPAGQALLFSLRFALVSASVMLVALLLFFSGVGLVAWIAANAYLLGSEYFELAAMRFRSRSEARAMRRHFAGQVYLAGLILSGFVAIPVLNLFTPLFAAALMTRLHKRLSRA